jgi:hypothetical protein
MGHVAQKQKIWPDSKEVAKNSKIFRKKSLLKNSFKRGGAKLGYREYLLKKF